MKQWVEVIFANSEYNYSTSVSDTTNEKNAREYFVGKWFNMGSYPKELMMQVKDIIFHEG